MRNVLVARLWTVPSTLLQVRQLGDRRILEAFTLTGSPSDDEAGWPTSDHRPVGVAPALWRRRLAALLLLTGREVLIVSAPTASGAGVPPRLPAIAPFAAACAGRLAAGDHR
ncbi:MAG: hypothetical protein IPP90_11430 [Gemmatimonadaceae bacterium]|nr:hypothetical protein [Gemmatimonadaceae bacterium]